VLPETYYLSTPDFKSSAWDCSKLQHSGMLRAAIFCSHRSSHLTADFSLHYPRYFKRGSAAEGSAGFE
jgi:hypothetical protein